MLDTCGHYIHSDCSVNTNRQRAGAAMMRTKSQVLSPFYLSICIMSVFFKQKIATLFCQFRLKSPQLIFSLGLAISGCGVVVGCA